MSTSEDLQEQRRQKLLEKLNKKYSRPFSEDTDPQEVNKIPAEEPKATFPTTAQSSQAKPTISSSEAYQNEKNLLRLNKQIKRVKTLCLLVYGIFSAFVISKKVDIKGSTSTLVPGLLTIYLIFLTYYRLKKKKYVLREEGTLFEFEKTNAAVKGIMKFMKSFNIVVEWGRDILEDVSCYLISCMITVSIIQYFDKHYVFPETMKVEHMIH